jgi:hypothetical protein
VVGVEIEGASSAGQLDQAARILAESGADFVEPAMA